eukprot:UN34602
MNGEKLIYMFKIFNEECNGDELYVIHNIDIKKCKKHCNMVSDCGGFTHRIIDDSCIFKNKNSIICNNKSSLGDKCKHLKDKLCFYKKEICTHDCEHFEEINQNDSQTVKKPAPKKKRRKNKKQITDFPMKKNKENVCDKYFDYGLLTTWQKDSEKDMPCMPSTEGEDKIQHSGLVQCVRMKHPYLNPATAPHVVCQGKNVVLDPTRIKKAYCLKHRKGYMCDGPDSYRQYKSGAFSALCQHRIKLKNFPADHFKDIF